MYRRVFQPTGGERVGWFLGASEAGTRPGWDVDDAGTGALGSVDGAVGGGVVGKAAFAGNSGIGEERWAFLHAGVERLGLVEEGRHHDGELDGPGIWWRAAD